MITVSIAVFIMMSVAASLGFAISWLYKNKQSNKYLEDYELKKIQINRLREEQESLVRHSNDLQANTLKISEKHDKQSKKIGTLKETVKQLQEDKDFLVTEYEHFQNEVEDKLAQRGKLLQALEELRDKNQKNKVKADKWKIKVHDLQGKLKETEVAYLQLKKEHEQHIQKSASGGVQTFQHLEWEEKYKKLKLQFLALTKEKQDIASEIEQIQSQESLPVDNTINKLSEEIVLLKKENVQLKSKLETPIKQPQILDPKEEVIKRIKSRKAQVNWERIGKATKSNADDLKILKGLGLLMEEKLHALGIYTFDQLAQLTDYDQKLLNYFLEIPKGKIENEKWVAQAQELVSREALSEETVQRIQQNLEQLNLGDKGEASPSQKDNLQSIIGIGPYIEQKLNAIGIFRFEQLARLNKADIDEINNIMKLAPGHIQKDDWVGQAKRMK